MYFQTEIESVRFFFHQDLTKKLHSIASSIQSFVDSCDQMLVSISSDANQKAQTETYWLIETEDDLKRRGDQVRSYKQFLELFNEEKVFDQSQILKKKLQRMKDLKKRVKENAQKRKQETESKDDLENISEPISSEEQSKKATEDKERDRLQIKAKRKLIFRGFIPFIEAYFTNIMSEEHENTERSTSQSSQTAKSGLIGRSSLSFNTVHDAVVMKNSLQNCFRKLLKLRFVQKSSTKRRIVENALYAMGITDLDQDGVKGILYEEEDSPIVMESTTRANKEERKPTMIGHDQFRRMNSLITGRSTADDSNPVMSTFCQFVHALQHSGRLERDGEREFRKMVNLFLEAEKLTDPNDLEYRKLREEGKTSQDVRVRKITFEDIAKRLIRHIRTASNSDHHVTVLRVLSAVLKEYDPDSHDVSNSLNTEHIDLANLRRKTFEQVQIQLDRYGTSELVLDIISRTSDDELAINAIELGVLLLRGGNASVQSTMLKFLQNEPSGSFFQMIRQRIFRTRDAVKFNRRVHKAMRRPSRSDIINTLDFSGISFSTKASGLNGESIMLEIRADLLFRLLQLMCEGHNLSMQNYLQSQPDKRQTVDLLTESVYLLNVIRKREKYKIEKKKRESTPPPKKKRAK